MATLYIEDLTVGLSRERETTVTRDLIKAFGDVSGDHNPVHFDDDFAKGTMFGGVIAHGMISASLLSAVIATDLPGPGTIYLRQSLAFKAPVRPGDAVVARVTVSTIDPAKRRVTLDCACFVGETQVLEGEAMVLAPSRAAG